MTPGAPGPAILIPAAGGSTRMRGRDKLLEPVRGRPLLAERVATALVGGRAVAAAAEVYVALPPRHLAPDRWAALDGSSARCITVADHANGLSASLRAGVAALPALCPGLMILPADMPDITADDIAALIDRFDGQHILRGASAEGRPGHPVLFPARDFAALRALAGDEGGRGVLAAASDRLRLVPLPADHALTDLDTPEDWARWRQAGP